MSEALLDELRQMRRDFDERFARPADPERETLEDVLAVSHGEARLALTLRGAGALLRTPPLTPIPSPSRALVGLAGIRGAVTALYDLGVLLGLEPVGRDARGWALLCSPTARVGLVFEAFDGFHRVAPEAVEQVRGPAGAGRAVRIDGELRRLLVPAELAPETAGGAAPPDDEET